MRGIILLRVHVYVATSAIILVHMCAIKGAIKGAIKVLRMVILIGVGLMRWTVNMGMNLYAEYNCYDH